MVRIVCGPVVGLVTSSSANVLLEVDESTTVKMILQNIETSENVEKSVDLKAKVPGMFLFKSLEEDCSYRILVPQVDDEYVRGLGRVKTFPKDIESVGVGVVSCDRPETAKTDLFEGLYKKGTAEDVRIILHIGDNVYIDGEAFAEGSTAEKVNDDKILLDPKKVDQKTPYTRARKLVAGLDKEDWPSKADEILEIYRDRYREVYMTKHKAKVLANFSNLMILDDHDIRDDIGIMPQDSDPDSKEFFLAKLALRAVHEYQRQLWDPDVFKKADDLKSEFYKIQVGPLKIMMTDSRMSRSLYKKRRQTGDDSYFGAEQTKEMMQCYVPDGITRMCLAVYTMPLVFLRRKIIQITEKLGRNDDITEFINSRNANEIEPILEAIEKFKQNLGPAGDVLLFAGDVHIGGFTDILKEKKGKDDVLVRQVTSSAIRNKQVGRPSFNALRTLMNSVESYGAYGYKHYDWTPENNYALLHVDFKQKDKLEYRVQLVDRKHTALRHSWDPEWDKGYKTKTSRVCNIL